MKLAVILALLGISCSRPVRPPTSAWPTYTYFVAVDGDDRWSGELPAPNDTHTDGPFASMEGARDAIRTLKRARGLPVGGVTVVVRGGRYERTEPFTLSLEDSGVAGAPIVYRSYPGEVAIITGARQINRLQPVADRDVLERLDPVARRHVLHADLRAQGITDYGAIDVNSIDVYFRDAPMRLARWPNSGFVHIAGLVGGSPVSIHGRVGDHVGAFIYDGSRASRWTHDPDVWLHGYWFWDWADSRQRVEAIDPVQKVITLAEPQHHYGYRIGQWYYAFNLLSELDTPGEWYLDRAAGLLYLWPGDQEGSVSVSVATDLLVLQDVSHVTFAGFTFQGARGVAVTISGGTDATLRDCMIRNVSGWGIRVDGGKQHAIRNCEITNTGLGGVWIKGGDRRTLDAANHVVHGCHIHQYSQWKRTAQAAVEIVGVGIKVTNNLIHDAPNMGISIFGNDHTIEDNELHHLCRESNDAGAIYAGRDWTMRGNQIRRNYLHDLSGFQGKGCNGVMLDDMFSGTVISENVFHRVTQAVLIGGGRDNTVDNNIFVDCETSLTIDARGLGWARQLVASALRPALAAVPYMQPPWSDRYPALRRILDDEPAAPSGNVITRNISVGGRWQNIAASAMPLTQVSDNLVDVDPRFVNRVRGDFRLRSASPALQLGFRPIEFERIGLPRNRAMAP